MNGNLSPHSNKISLNFKTSNVTHAVWHPREFALAFFDDAGQIGIATYYTNIIVTMMKPLLKFYTNTAPTEEPIQSKSVNWKPYFDGTVYTPTEIEIKTKVGKFYCTRMWVSYEGIRCEWSYDQANLYYGRFKYYNGSTHIIIDGNSPGPDSSVCCFVTGSIWDDINVFSELPICGAASGTDGSVLVFNRSSRTLLDVNPTFLWHNQYFADTDIYAYGDEYDFKISRFVQTGNNLVGMSLEGDLKSCALVRQGSTSTQATDNYFLPIHAPGMRALFDQLNLILKEKSTTMIKFDVVIGNQPFCELGYKQDQFICRTTSTRLIRAAITSKIILRNIVAVDTLIGLQATPVTGFSSWVMPSRSRQERIIAKLQSVQIEKQAWAMAGSAAIGAGKGLFEGLSSAFQWGLYSDWARQMQRERLAMMEKIADMNNKGKLQAIAEQGQQNRITQASAYTQTMDALGAGSVSAQNGMYSSKPYSSIRSLPSTSGESPPPFTTRNPKDPLPQIPIDQENVNADDHHYEELAQEEENSGYVPFERFELNKNYEPADPTPVMQRTHLYEKFDPTPPMQPVKISSTPGRPMRDKAPFISRAYENGAVKPGRSDFDPVLSEMKEKNFSTPRGPGQFNPGPMSPMLKTSFNQSSVALSPTDMSTN